jgi:hypothetical protein
MYRKSMQSAEAAADPAPRNQSFFLVQEQLQRTLKAPCVYSYNTHLNATLPRLATSKSPNSPLPAPCVPTLFPTQDNEDNKHNTTKSAPTTPNQQSKNHYTIIRPPRPILLPPQQQLPAPRPNCHPKPPLQPSPTIQSDLLR